MIFNRKPSTIGTAGTPRTPSFTPDTPHLSAMPWFRKCRVMGCSLWNLAIGLVPVENSEKKQSLCRPGPGLWKKWPFPPASDYLQVQKLWTKASGNKPYGTWVRPERLSRNNISCSRHTLARLGPTIFMKGLSTSSSDSNEVGVSPQGERCGMLLDDDSVLLLPDSWNQTHMMTVCLVLVRWLAI